MSRVFPEGARRAGGSVQGGTVAERSALLEHSWPQGCQQDVGCADKCFAKKASDPGCKAERAFGMDRHSDVC